MGKKVTQAISKHCEKNTTGYIVANDRKVGIPMSILHWEKN